jgi:tyrosine-protein phosphatase SIW14
MGFVTRVLVVCALTTGIALSPTAGRAEDAPRSSASSSRTAVKVEIDNFGQVNANYYRGAQPVGHDYADLKALGVKTVIDLQGDGSPAEKGLVEGAGMTFHRIPMTTRDVPTGEQLATFLTLVNDPANQPVYVHCAGGRHRTGVMTAVYRMTRDGWAADRAFKEMKQYKFGADLLHPEFKRFVYAYKAEPPAPTRGVVATNILGNAQTPAAAK